MSSRCPILRKCGLSLRVPGGLRGPLVGQRNVDLSLDFELALCCFEATHKVSFADRLWETDPEEYEEMSIEEFIEAYVEWKEQRDPLFVTKRFLMFQESLTKALTDEAEEPPEDY